MSHELLYCIAGLVAGSFFAVTLIRTVAWGILATTIALSLAPTVCVAHPLDLVVIKLSLQGEVGDGSIILKGPAEPGQDSPQEGAPDNFDIQSLIGDLYFTGADRPCSILLRQSVQRDAREYAFTVSCPGRTSHSEFRIARRPDLLSRLSVDMTTIYLISIDGRRYTTTLTRDESEQAVPLVREGVFAEFLNLGIKHIGAARSEWVRNGKLSLPEGIDHILFVLTLVLASSSLLSLVKTATGFTLGHSITLAFVTLFQRGISPAIVEPAIAASIAVMALDATRKDPWKRPWIPAFLFGLLHGCGFAAVLLERRLEGATLFFGLLGFNLGVELGQLVFVLLFSAAIFLLSRALGSRRLVVLVAAMSVFVVATWWFVERVIGF